jgi:hypothetical protein
MYFQVKNTLNHNRYHIFKHILNSNEFHKKKNKESRFLEKIIFNILYNFIDLPIMF